MTVKKENLKGTLDELEKNIKKTKKTKKKKISNPKQSNLKFKIVDVEKENEAIKSQLEQISASLSSESNDRKSILKEVNESIDLYSSKLIEYENKIDNFELQEIKYKNQERELQDYVLMYNNKCEEFNEESEKLNKEIIKLRKDMKYNETVLSSLRTIVTLMIKEYDIDNISKLTGIEVDNIEKYLQE